MEPRQPTQLDDFLFDPWGYLILKGAVEPDLVDDLNSAIDALPLLDYGQWFGNAQRRDYHAATGFELHNCVEAGEPFERLIDHPGWINSPVTFFHEATHPQHVRSLKTAVIRRKRCHERLPRPLRRAAGFARRGHGILPYRTD